MRRRKLLHPVTSEHHREIDIRVLAKAGAFKRPMRFPFQHLESAPDHIKVFRVGDKSRQTPQIVAVQWRPMTFGLKPFFICPRASRRVLLYHDSLFCYCRKCADLWFRSQQVRRRTRLLHRSHRIRISLGDETGKPGSPFPARPYLQRKTRYRRTISTLRHVEQQYMHIVATDGRRDEYGRFMPSEKNTNSDTTDELGR